MENCPCGGEAYSACCEPVIKGTRSAETAEQLMRARYSAYATKEMEFLYESNHPDYRKDYDHEGTRKWAESARWEGLEIVDGQRGGTGDTTGEVEFIAAYRDKDGLHHHHELAHFRKQQGEWYFTEGTMVRPKPLISNKIGRNDPCTCGSGNKYKKCCGR